MNISLRLHTLLSAAWRRRYMIVVPMMLFPLCGYFIGSASPKKFVSHTSMLIQETAKMNPFLEDFAVSAMLKERMAALETLLHSRHILGSVAEDLQLVDETSESYQRDQVIAQLSSRLSMQMAGKDLIRIDLRGDDPSTMKATLEAVSRHFIEQLLAPERSSIRDSSSFLSQHLAERRKELDIAEEALAVFKNQNAQTLPELHPSNIAQLSKLKETLAEKEAELAGVIKSMGSLNEQISKTNPIIGRIEEKIVNIRSELALLRARYTNEHSKVQAALRKLRRLESERKSLLENSDFKLNSEQIWDIASLSKSSEEGQQVLMVSQLENLQNARSKVDGLSEETERLRAMVEKLERVVTSYGAQEHKLNQLMRDLKIKRDLYGELLQRYEMAQVTGSLGEFEENKRIKVIDLPYTPSAPINLPPIIFVIAGVFGGLFLGAGFALVVELCDTTLRTRARFQEMTGLPVISRIPPLDDSAQWGCSNTTYLEAA